MPAKKSPLRTFAAACIIVAGVCGMIMLYAVGLTNKSATQRDYIEYWAAGQQLARGANPYDVTEILRLEKTAGLQGDSAKVTPSPPVVLLLAWPLGYFSAKTGLILWQLASLGCLAISVWMLWLLNGRPRSGIHLAGYVFPPVLASLMAGQLGIFFLLEVVLFLYFHKSRPWVAGAVLVLIVLKPHLFLPCAVVLLLWSASQREFRVVAGFLAVLAASCGLTLLLDQHVWMQYEQMVLSARLMDVFLPTLGVAFRFLVDRNARWLEFLPEAAGCIWAGWYYWTQRNRWDWGNQGLLLLLVSLVCTPYSWYSDQAMLWPAILVGLYCSEKSLRSLVFFGLIAGAGLAGVFAGIQLPSAFYIWTAPAWLVWYLYATRSKSVPEMATVESAISVE